MSNLTRYRSLILAGFCVVITGLLLQGYRVEMRRISIGRTPWPLLRAELAMHDWLELVGRKTPSNQDLVFIGIDASSMQLEGASREEIDASPALTAMSKDWPWDRSVHAMILDRLAAAGARVVIFDLLFTGPRSGDEVFKSALSQWHDRVVLASNCESDPSQGDRRALLSLPTASILPQDTSESIRVGYVNYYPDTDGVIRRMKSQLVPEDISNGAFDPDSQVQDSLVAAALRQIGLAQLIPGRESVPFRYTGTSGTFQAHPAYELFVPEIWAATNYKSGAALKGKIVIVGPAGGFQHDSNRVAVDKSMPGPEIHLNVINALLHKEILSETSPNTDQALIALGGLAAWIIGATVRQPALRFSALAGVSSAFIALLWFLYNRIGLLAAGTTPLLAMNCAGGAGMVFDFVLERMEKSRFRRTLERYVSKNVVKEILDNPASYINTLGGMRRPVALLFTDLRGFTTMTEAADPVQFVAQLKEYFTEMVKPVFANDGTLDKFIGDAIMAVWGNVVSHGSAHDVQMAVKTALEMKEGLARLNQRWSARGVQPFAMGMGVNHGMVVAGEIGSPEKMDITVIGDAVNLASRIEGLTKMYHVDILLGEEASAQVRDLFHLQSVDLVQVKGKTKPVKVSTVHGPKTDPLPDAMREYLERYEAGIEAYWTRRFSAAEQVFEECLRLKPEDFLADMYRERCVKLSASPPEESWDGVFIMTEK